MMPLPTKLTRALSNPFKKGTSKQHGMILAAAQQSVEDMSSHSRVLQSPAWESVDYYDRDDIRVGKLLQGGAFFDCYKVKRLPDQDASENSSRGSRASSFGHTDDEELLEGSSSKNNHSSSKKRDHFVVKQMTPKVFSENAQVLQQAALGLVLEAKYLSRLTHKNIIRAKGLPFGEESCLSHGTPGGFFLVTARMVETLSDRMDRWRHLPADAGDDKPTKVEGLEGRKFRGQLSLARDIASALHYLHQHRLVLINLNPSHIGFLEDGTLQITDLSCAQELHDDTWEKHAKLESDPSADPAVEDHKQRKRPGKGRHATNTSTSVLVQIAADGKVPRYVAPEVVLKKDDWCAPQADSYSFALILFELLTLSQVYIGYKAGQHRTKVCIDGQRPNPSVYKLPKILGELLARSWRKSASKRLTMAQILQALTEPQQEAMMSVAPRQA